MGKKVCSNSGTTYIMGDIIAKENLNISNLMQTLENLLLQNCSTEIKDNVKFKDNLNWLYHLHYWMKYWQYSLNIQSSSLKKPLNRILKY